MASSPIVASPNTETFRDALESMSGQRVVVIGDIMLDQFIYGKVNRISPEAPALVLAIESEKSMPGGAANVAMQVAALGARCHLIGLCGDDSAAEKVRQQLLQQQPSITLDTVCDSTLSTTVKTRFISHPDNAHLLRADRDPVFVPAGDIVTNLTSRAIDAMSKCNIVILSDYAKGTLQPELVRSIVEAARKRGLAVIVDPKGHDWTKYRDASVITPNLAELSLVGGDQVKDHDNAIAIAAGQMIDRFNFGAVCVKQGADGAQMIKADGSVERCYSKSQNAIDVAGAGDSFVATLAVAIAAGATLDIASHIANAASGIVVAKKGVATSSFAELYAALPDDQENRKVFGDCESLVMQVDSWKASGLKVGFTNGCFDLLHPGHVATLAQAKSQVDRLVLALNSDDSIRRLKGATRPIQNEVSRAMVVAALGVVDAVILFHEDTPLRLIEQLKPDLIVKGGDYNAHEVVGHDVVSAYGGRVMVTDFWSGHSTTSIVSRASPKNSESYLPSRDSSDQASSGTTMAMEDEPYTFRAGTRVKEEVGSLHAWLCDYVWPFWLRHGLERDTRGTAIAFNEHIGLNAFDCDADTRRLRVAARQIFVFSQALEAGVPGAEEAVTVGIQFLEKQAYDSVTGGYHSHFDLSGDVIASPFCLYDHAFVLLAFASAMRVLPTADMRERVYALDRKLQSVIDFETFELYHNSPTMFSRTPNALMHLLEAYLASVDVFGPAPFLDRADALVTLFEAKFWQMDSGALPEHFNEDLDLVLENGKFITSPGHHAEWVWLLDWYHRTRVQHGRAVDQSQKETMAALVRFYEYHGVSSKTGALLDEVWDDGEQQEYCLQRLWPQTERLKAEILRVDAQDSNVLKALQVIRTYTEAAPRGLWRERRESSGAFIEENCQASTLYHLTSAITLAYTTLVGHEAVLQEPQNCQPNVPEKPLQLDLDISAAPVPFDNEPSTEVQYEDAGQRTCHLSGKKPLVVVTGAAGFIGSTIATALNAKGTANIVVCDVLGSKDKWQNLKACRLQDVVPPDELLSWLGDRDHVHAVIHFGANSSTTASDADEVMRSNFRSSLGLLDWCTKHKVKFIYASSSATYGDGSHGFDDDMSLDYLQKLEPLNLYAWSKHLFDQVVATRYDEGQPLPPVCVGLKLFNVYGRNEHHKGDMASLVSKYLPKIKAGEAVDLFRSCHPDFLDGEQLRDFVHVDDVANVVLWLLENAKPGVALYNVGTGKASSFTEFVGSAFDALGLDRRINFIDMPDRIKSRYQNFTEARLDRLRGAGYLERFETVQQAVPRIVRKS